MKRAEQGVTNDAIAESPLVLVVDDLALNRIVLTEIVSTLGYRVAEAANGREALEAIRSLHPVLVLMDIEMPVLDGMSAVRELRRDPQFQTLPVIAVTALNTLQARQGALAAGFSTYITKPCSVREIMQATDELAKHRASDSDKETK